MAGMQMQHHHAGAAGDTPGMDMKDRVEPVPHEVLPMVSGARGSIACANSCTRPLQRSPRSQATTVGCSAEMPPPALPACGQRPLQALRDSPAGISLFKEEFRAAQRLRGAEGVFIPEVGPAPEGPYIWQQRPTHGPCAGCTTPRLNLPSPHPS